MHKLILTAMVAAVLTGVAATSAGAAVPYLGLAEARREANDWLAKKPLDDWNVGACYRIGRYVVQCRFWSALDTALCCGKPPRTRDLEEYNVKVLNCRQA